MQVQNKVSAITMSAVFAALYVVLTVLVAPIAYGPIQFRISEVLVLLCFYNKKYIPAMIVGCFLANMISFMPIDIIFGTLGTVFAVVPMPALKKRNINIYAASLLPVISNGIIVGIMLNIYGEPLFLSMAQVALGEFAVVTLFGATLFRYGIERNERVMSLLRNANGGST